MAQTNRVIWTYPDSGDEDLVFTTPENAWRVAENSAENHIAGWVFWLSDRPVLGYRLATQVTIEGLPRRKPHPQGRFTWQCEGAALLIATGLDTVERLEAYLNDYRTTEGRIDRKRDTASRERVRLICAELEAGVHPRDAIARHRLPSVKRDAVTQPMTNEDAAALAFYRQMVSAGELAAQ